ncbi:FecR domain-containing protein [Rubritalea tangerina]|uniref:FecR domain-containing protein n=2 Tax=Rubritalea tangerina TaxID=430798 RepID=A0ABW4Z9A9_9BACT
MTEKERKELQAIVDKQLDDPPLQAEEIQRLESLLESDDCLDYYLKLMTVEGRMSDAVEGAEIVDAAVVPFESVDVKSREGWWTAAVAAAVAFFIGVSINMFDESQIAESEEIAESAGGRVKVVDGVAITSLFGVRWSGESADLINPEVIEIDSGLVELVYSIGTRVILEGPARYRVTGVNGGNLAYGKFVAQVPPGAEGFTVDYPMGKVVDLGTEFGVDLRQGGDLSIGVFEGEVELHPAGSDEVALIEKDHALLQRVKKPAELESIPFDRGGFVRLVPSREFAWEVHSAGREVLEFDVSHLVWTPGKYRALVKWMSGVYKVDIYNASLWCDGQMVAEDVHLGSSGFVGHTEQNIYDFEISDGVTRGGEWVLKVEMARVEKVPSGKSVAKGILYFEEGIAYAASEEDFCGRWRYAHNGSVWERCFLPGGGVALYRDGEEIFAASKSRWFVEDGVLRLSIPGVKLTEDHMLRDENTLIFVGNVYRNAHRVID